MTKRIAQSEDRILQTQGTPWFVQLIGLPFVALGLYILSFAAMGLIELMQYGSGLDWLTVVPGIAVTILFGLLFLSPGALFFARHSLIVHKPLGVVGVRWELWKLHTKGRVEPIKNVQQVFTRQKTHKPTSRKANERSQTRYYVEMKLKEGKDFELNEFPTKTEARELGKRIASFLNLPFHDRLRGKDD